MNPYKVLDVSEDATQEEIRAAYLKLVKKYHPDRYVDNPLKELANEKLKEINEAYEMLTKKGSSASSGHAGSYHQNSGYGSSSHQAYSGPNAAEFARARAYINQNNLQAAKAVLDAIPNRNAEWNYLYGVIYLRQGWYDQAREYIARAYEQEPHNAEYRNAYTALNNAGNPFYRSNQQGQGPYVSGCGGCDLCSTLLCANCCCDACGGNMCC